MPLDLAMTPKAAHWEIASTACEIFKAQQRPAEFAEVLTLVSEIQPLRIMLEIGCADGGSLYGWTKVCPEVYGITRWQPENRYRKDWHGATVLLDNSHSLYSLAWIKEELSERPLDVLFIDGDHSYEGAKKDFEMYSPLVRTGGLVLMHDVSSRNEPGLRQYWEDLGTGYIYSDTNRLELEIGYGVIVMGEE
jgi:cephalosporin hydroxylase